METTIKTLQQCLDENLSHFVYSNGDYEWTEKDGRTHLIRDGMDLLADVIAIDCYSYPNGDYRWTDANEHYHLIRSGVDLLEGVYAVCCYSCEDGSYGWMDRQGQWRLVTNGKPATNN